MNTRYEARSASDKTDDWPYWMVWDTQAGVNVTIRVLEKMAPSISVKGYGLYSREVALVIADEANKRGVVL